ncbi:MAG: polymer-forming cytoskeletal protein [Verrucomicrobiaceae bacterium]|nr:polymer-forming cytoskeletal protein [Verrucomicrobiaceae bacterium]
MHLTIQKRRVTASSVTRSGVGGEDWTQDSQPAAAEPAKPAAPPPAPEPKEEPEQLSLLPETVSTEDREPSLSAADGFGAFLRQQAGTATPEPAQKPAPRQTRTALPSQPAEAAPPPEGETPEESSTATMRRPMSNSPPPTPAPAPMNASAIQKMRDQGMYRNQYFKDAECFDCGHKFKTGRSARSANCPSCGAYISLEDVEVNMNSNQAVKTRGDVIIRKRGHLSTSSVQCRDLRCQGIIEANVQCSGDAIFKASGLMIGEIRCRRFVVEKGSDITLKNPVRAEEVEIHARVTGTIFCTGPVLIGTNGSVNGDVTARSVSIEPGGELNGAMNIVRSRPAT